MNQLYECGVCKMLSYDENEIKECEEKHDILAVQAQVIADEIAKFYAMGGNIEVSVGSLVRDLDKVIYSNEAHKLTYAMDKEEDEKIHPSSVDEIGFSNNTLQLKNWTTGSFGKLLKRFRGMRR